MLINKLQSLEIYGLELGWFSSYLNDRCQVTEVGDHYSTKSPVNFDVPQGSILGPFYLQFISMIFPKNLESANSKVYLYADDTAIFVKGKSVEAINRTLNSELEKVSKWLQKNYLTLNNKKTKSMLFATQQKLGRSNKRLQVYIKNYLLENVDGFKYLGIWLDPSLTWSSNTDKLVSKVNKRVGLLRRNVLPQRTLNLLYKSLIVPHLDYCNVVWGNTCKTFLSKLDKLQMLLAKSFLAFLVGILLSSSLTPLAGKSFMIAAPIIWKLWSSKVFHANSRLICAIFSIKFMKPTVTWLERAPREIWFHPDARIIPTNVNLLTEGLLHLTIFQLLQKAPFHQVLVLSNIFYPNNLFWWFLPYVQFLLFLNVSLYL